MDGNAFQYAHAFLTLKRVLGLKNAKKLAENQENRLFYGTLIPFGGPEGGGGSCDEKFFFSKVAHFLLSGTCQVWGALEKPFLRY